MNDHNFGGSVVKASNCVRCKVQGLIPTEPTVSTRWIKLKHSLKANVNWQVKNWLFKKINKTILIFKNKYYWILYYLAWDIIKSNRIKMSNKYVMENNKIILIQVNKYIA